MRSALSVAAATIAMLAVESPVDISGGPPRPGEGRRRKPTPAYVPKVPTTPADFDRIDAAENKRARKAAKLARAGL